MSDPLDVDLADSSTPGPDPDPDLVSADEATALVRADLRIVWNALWASGSDARDVAGRDRQFAEWLRGPTGAELVRDGLDAGGTWVTGRWVEFRVG